MLNSLNPPPQESTREKRLKAKGLVGGDRLGQTLALMSRIRQYAMFCTGLRIPCPGRREPRPYGYLSQRASRRFVHLHDHPREGGWFPSSPVRRGFGRLRNAVYPDRVRQERSFQEKP